MNQRPWSAARVGSAAALLVLLVSCSSSPKPGGGGAGGSGAGGKVAGGGGGGGSGTGGSGAGGGDGGLPDGGTFACGKASCARDTEYCFYEEWNGADKVGPVCRPLPSGCSTCQCAEQDATAITLACTTHGVFVCTDGMAPIGAGASSPTLWVLCQVA